MARRNRLFLLDLGRMNMPLSGFFGDLAGNDPVGQEIVEFPVSASLIEAPEGRILYDVGCHPQAMSSDGRWSEDIQSQYPWSGDETCHLPHRLEQLGLGPNDIDYVVLSHLHSDHAGCVEFFRESQVIVHRQEFKAAMAAHQRREADSFYAARDIDEWLRLNLNWCMIEDDEDELKLGEQVTLLNWGPGHSSGMLGLDVELDDTGHIILASDAVYSLANFGPPQRPTEFNISNAKAAQTVEKIRQRAQRHSAEVWCGHDMTQFLSLRHSTEGWYE